MSKDPLDFFNSITSKIGKHMEDEQDFPGSTSPRNRGKVFDTPEHIWLQSLQSKDFLVNGQVRRFYPVGSLAQALHRKPVTIRSWESKGWLPPASFRTPPPKGEQIPGKATKGRRLYSEAQVVFLVEAAMTYEIDDPDHADWEGFRDHIANYYPKH